MLDAQQRWQILRLHVQDGVSLTELSRQTGVGLRTLQRWHARFQADGTSGLERPRRCDASTRRVAPSLAATVEALALTKPRPAMATIHRAVTQIAHRDGLAPPSYTTVRSIVHGLDPAMVTLALEGPASYRDKYELVLRRRAAVPNEMWQVDHTELDILILGSNGRPARPWLTIVEDDHSRAVCGYLVFLGAPSALNTALALRQGIWNKADPRWAMCGLPDLLYVDHGSDFTSGHFYRTAIDLHIRVTHSTVARPQGRGKIERFYGTVNTELLTTLPGHLAPGQRHPDPVLTLSQLDQQIATFIGAYNHRVHQEIKTTPHQAWIADGWLPRMPESLDALDGFLLFVAKPRVVQRDGIHFQGLQYLSPTLASFVGARVTIRYDPRDISEIRVFDHDSYVCTAIDEEHATTAFSLKDIQAARNARRRALRAGIHERIPTRVPSVETGPLTEPLPPPRPRQRLRTYAEDE